MPRRGFARRLQGDATLREIGSVVREQDARTLADHLLTLNITTKLAPTKEGAWAVWVHREDRVPEARAVLADFEKDPADPRFQASAKTAKEIRKKKEQEERAYRKRVKDLRDRWEGAMYQRAPLAFALIVICVAVTVLLKFFPSLTYYFWFSLSFKDEIGAIYDTGFQAIQRGEVWRLITPIFLHFGIWHLVLNMMGMRYLGERIEMRKGSWRFALICLVAAIAGNIGQFYATGGKGHTDLEDGLSLDQRNVNLMLGWFLLGILAPMAFPESHGFPFNMANVAHGVGLIVGVLFGLLRF
jgi:GlpG protein